MNFLLIPLIQSYRSREALWRHLYKSVAHRNDKRPEAEVAELNLDKD